MSPTVMDSEPDDGLNMDSGAKSKKRKANKRQSKDVDMRDDSNLDVDVEQKEVANLEANSGKKSKIKKQAVCVKCKQTKTIVRCLMCSPCYKKHLEAKREQEGRQEAKRLIICLKCNLLKKHCARQLCSSCYTSARKFKKLKEYSTTRVKLNYRKQGICIKCNKSKILYELFMCRTCVKKDRKARCAVGAQKCGNCGRFEVLELNGFCSDCNSDKRIRKMADEFGIYQDLETVLKSIENNELVSYAHLTVHASLSPYATYFKQFSKIKFDFLNFGTLDDSNNQLDSRENFGSNKYSIGNEDFIGRLKQYTQSKLKPLKKQSKPLNTENASSIFNIPEKRSANSISTVKQPSKIKIPSKPKVPKLKEVTLKECVDCKQIKPHEARDRCSACYQRFMKQKKKEDAEKAKIIEQNKKESSQNDDTQKINADQVDVSSGKPKKKRSKKQSTDA